MSLIANRYSYITKKSKRHYEIRCNNDIIIQFSQNSSGVQQSRLSF